MLSSSQSRAISVFAWSSRTGKRRRAASRSEFAGGVYWDWVGFVPPLPTVLGHEFCGVSEEVGPEVKRFRKAQRVVTPFHHFCGVCESCRAGHQNVGSDLQLPGFHYSGGYGQYAQVGRADVNLVPLPNELSFEVAASMGCRLVTAFHGVVHQADVKPGEWVAVFGCGGVGLAAVEIANALGSNVIAVSRGKAKLVLAESRAPCTS
jgi:D-arabinose 1-dehydrogenase-like Zn-dependent alcohol dehydrogenase